MSPRDEFDACQLFPEYVLHKLLPLGVGYPKNILINNYLGKFIIQPLGTNTLILLRAGCTGQNAVRWYDARFSETGQFDGIPVRSFT